MKIDRGPGVAGPPLNQRPEPPKETGGANESPSDEARAGVCPICAGRLIEIRGHLECRLCHRLVEGCCEGGCA
jgi:hypothetical protein